MWFLSNLWSSHFLPLECSLHYCQFQFDRRTKLEPHILFLTYIFRLPFHGKLQCSDVHAWYSNFSGTHWTEPGDSTRRSFGAAHGVQGKSHCKLRFFSQLCARLLCLMNFVERIGMINQLSHGMTVRAHPCSTCDSPQYQVTWHIFLACSYCTIINRFSSLELLSMSVWSCWINDE